MWAIQKELTDLQLKSGKIRVGKEEEEEEEKEEERECTW